MKNINDIKDDEFRVIGQSSAKADVKPGGDSVHKKKFWWIVLLVVLHLTGFALFYFLPDKNTQIEPEEGIFEPQTPVVQQPVEKKKFGRDVAPDAKAFTEKIDTIVNDIPLEIYIPHNATAQLCLRTPDINDTNIIFCAQAADVRKDNKKIVGAFVLKGEPLAGGLSKRGYCAIIEDKITVGVADNSPLFEQATEVGGYFFRQYPLVDNGVLVENEPKNKSIRKALCDRAGEIFVVTSATKESFHDFTQALVDLGVDNAIYIVGGEYAKGWYKNAAGEIIDFSKSRRDRYRYENYIVWRE